RRDLAFLRGNELDHHSQRERDEIGDVRPDWDLPLDAFSRKPPIVGERVPQRALGIGGIAAKEPRKPAHWTARGSPAALPVLGEQRAERGGFLAVEHAAARRPLTALAQRDNDAVQRLYVLLGRLHARENVAQIDQHGRALLERTEIFDRVEVALEMGEER